MKTRLNYIDSSRGIAIILVVIGHIIPMDVSLNKYIYSFHMPIFFILSGILLYNSKTLNEMEYRKIIYKKVKTLMYPYFTFSFLSILCIISTEGLIKTKEAIISTFIFDGIETLWFLPALFMAEIASIFIFRSFKRKSVIVVFLLMLISVGYSLFGYPNVTKFHHILRILNIINRSMIGTIFIFIGFLLKKIASDQERMFSTNIQILVMCFCFALDITLSQFNKVDLHYSIIGDPLFFYFNSLTGSISILLLAKIILSNVNLLLFYGKNSLVVFATHVNLGIVYLTKIYISNPVIDCLIVLVIEFFIVTIINRKMSFLIRPPKR